MYLTGRAIRTPKHFSQRFPKNTQVKSETASALKGKFLLRFTDSKQNNFRFFSFKNPRSHPGLQGPDNFPEPVTAVVRRPSLGPHWLLRSRHGGRQLAGRSRPETSGFGSIPRLVSIG